MTKPTTVETVLTALHFLEIVAREVELPPEDIHGDDPPDWRDPLCQRDRARRALREVRRLARWCAIEEREAG